jgi:hypothetical protein
MRRLWSPLIASVLLVLAACQTGGGFYAGGDGGAHERLR